MAYISLKNLQRILSPKCNKNKSKKFKGKSDGGNRFKFPNFLSRPDAAAAVVALLLQIRTQSGLLRMLLWLRTADQFG